jgi:tight adherence protein B
MNAAVLGFAGAAAAVLGGLDLLALRRPATVGDTGAIRAVAGVFARAGREGVDPGAAERRRVLATGAVAAFAVGWFFFGFAGAFVAAAAAPTVVARLLRARRDRYRRSVDTGAAEIAIALADALSGGRSLRGAIEAAAGSVVGPPGNELSRVAAELDLGAATDDALEGMRRRIGRPGIDVIVAGALMQRRAGGDMAGLLRTCARAFEDEARLLGEVKAATAQARFTGMVVVLLPLGGAALAELGSPGFVRGLVTSPLSGWLVGMAVAMQIGAAFAIRRLAEIRA